MLVRDWILVSGFRVLGFRVWVYLFFNVRVFLGLFEFRVWASCCKD